MSNALMLTPVFAMVALTFFVLVRMGRSRAKAVISKQTKIRDIALSEQAWSDEVKKVSNNYANQMQIPFLFYAAVGFFIILGKADLIALILSWAFVAARYMHAFIHIGSNNVGKRFRVFGIGVLILVALWVWLAIRLYVLG